MYDAFYKLTADPFRLSPDHRFSFGHSSYAAAKAYLEYALFRGEGFITITGGAGTGKTTLIGEIMSGVDSSRIEVATLNSTQLEDRDLLHMVAASFGMRLQDDSKAGLLLALEQFLAQQSRKGHRSVLIVDEAQGLSHRALEELRLLANLQLNDRLLLQVFLVGQEQLRELVWAPGMEHLSQRIIAAAHLEPLNLEDTVSYVEHRLSRVRWQGDPKIDEDALRLIHRYSGGVPRRINLICSRLFLHGAMESRHELTGEDARSIIEDLQLEGLIAVNVPEPPAGKTDTADVVLSLPREREGAADADAPAAGKEFTAAPESSPRKPPLREAMGNVIAELENRQTPPPRPSAGTPGAPGAPGIRPDRASPARPAPAKKSKSSIGLGKLALFLVVGGTLIVVANQMFDFRRDEPADAAMKRLDNADAGGLQRPGAALPEADRISAPAIPATDVSQADAQMLSEPSATGPVPEKAAAGEAARGADGAGEMTSKPPAGVTDARLPIQGEIVRAAPVDDAGGDVANPDSTAAGQRLAPAPTTDAVPAQVTRPAMAEPVKENVGDGAAGSSTTPRDEKARLTEEAEQRFERRLTQLEVTAERVEPQSTSLPRQQNPAQPVTPVVPVKPPTTDFASGPVLASQPKISTGSAEPPATKAPANTVSPTPTRGVTSAPIRPSLPKVAKAPVVVAKATPAPAQAPVLRPEQTRSALLSGGWSSRGQPASLLPSDVTLCRGAGNALECWSVPRNIKTKYGEALYKIEATLQNFSADGKFQVAYRTLVKLGGTNADKGAQSDSGNDDWQVSEHAMDCQLLKPDEVSCRDAKGVTRTYNR